MDDNFRPIWQPTLTSDITANSSNKTITVPTNFIWLPTSIRIAYSTNATVGNRQLEVRYETSAGTIFLRKKAKVTQSAELVYDYNFFINSEDAGSVIASIASTDLYNILPYAELPPGTVIRIIDSSAIAPAGSGENMLIYVNYRGRPWL